MKRNKLTSSVSFALLLMLFACAQQLSAQDAATKPGKPSSAPQWNVQVEKVDAGDVVLEPAFRIAIYENLLDELAKTKHFKQVFRSGDRKASDLTDLLILKTTVLKYSAGSETKRAVTTVAGATKLNVSSQLCKQDGTVVVENTVEGNVRFFGGNLRATHNLAKNIANKVKASKLPESPTPAKTS